ncbi:MAG: peptidase M16 [Candidatus Aminicenantes bacterium]|nr:peptidase M16 [Candidatus Aminicenantes bacterium]
MNLRISTFKKFLKPGLGLAFLLTIHLPNVLSQETPVEKPTLQKTKLSNGLYLIYEIDKAFPTTFLQVLVKGGTGAVPEGKEGLAYLATRMTVEIPDRGKIREMMKQATRISMRCFGDYSLINLKCLTENLEESLKVMAPIIQKPLFSGIRISRIKEYMIHISKSEEDDPIIVGKNAHLQSFFGDSAYGGAIFGTEESLKTIKKKDIEGFYENHFAANNMIVAVSSDLEEKLLIEMIQRYFGKFPQNKWEASKPAGPALPEERQLSLEKDTKQTLVSMAFPLPELTAKNFVLAFMTENLLGKGVDSKLWSIRAKERLAYNVNSQVIYLRGGGIIRAYLETKNENKQKALESLKQVLRLLNENGMSEEELQATKIGSRANFLRLNETKEARVSTLADFEALGLGYGFFDRFFAEVDAVSLEEINVFIKEILSPEKGVEVVVGPKSEESAPPPSQPYYLIQEPNT